VSARLQAQEANYTVGPQDVLQVNVWQQPGFSGRFGVEADGSFALPLVGRVKVAGLTATQIEGEIRQRLMDGYLRNPRVTVTVETYRSQQVFVVGEVRTPGTQVLSGGMTLMEVLARAGSTTVEASGEVLVVRPRNGGAAEGPTMPAESGEAEDAEIVRVDIGDLQAGVAGKNLVLRGGDTVYLPRGERVYVFGQVRSPGAYPMQQRQMTVLQALSLAGGVTERGAANRIRIDRLVDGEKKEIKVKLGDLVRPGDTIVVPERYF
jgi:polysaccharide export outer membrane protein